MRQPITRWKVRQEYHVSESGRCPRRKVRYEGQFVVRRVVKRTGAMSLTRTGSLSPCARSCPSHRGNVRARPVGDARLLRRSQQGARPRKHHGLLYGPRQRDLCADRYSTAPLGVVTESSPSRDSFRVVGQSSTAFAITSKHSPRRPPSWTKVHYP